MLTGDLKDFSLREILQFLTATGSSGVLELRNAESHAGIAVHDGGVCIALLDIGGIHGLAARLIRVGGVDVARLRELGAQTDGDAIDSAAALAWETAEHDAAADVFREHTYETLGWLTRREEARFSFEGSAQLDEWPLDVIELAEALAEVDDRASDWDELHTTVSDLTRVCSAVPDVSGIDEISLSMEQWRVLSLIDGRRQLKDLIELSGMGHLETCRHLDELVIAGLVELVEPGEPSTLASLLQTLDALRPRHTSSSLGQTSSEPVQPQVEPRHTGRAAPARRSDGQRAHQPSSRRATRVDDGRADPTGELRPLEVVSPDTVDVDDGGAVLGDDDLEAVDVVPSDANRTLFERLIGGGGVGG